MCVYMRGWVVDHSTVVDDKVRVIQDGDVWSVSGGVCGCITFS